jgi:hypothetical protein
LSPSYDLAPIVPEKVRRAVEAAEIYKLFFVFESYLREFIVEVLSKEGADTLWEKVPPDLQAEVTRLEETEEVKGWMALGSRDKSALMTLPQLLKVIEHNWKQPRRSNRLSDRHQSKFRRLQTCAQRLHKSAHPFSKLAIILLPPGHPLAIEPSLWSKSAKTGILRLSRRLSGFSRASRPISPLGDFFDSEKARYLRAILEETGQCAD